MGAAESLEASPPSTPEERRRGSHEWGSPSPARPAERRPPPRPEPAWEVSRGATPRSSASAARHASPQRVAWGTPQSARSRVALAAEHESHGARGPYRRELLQESSGHAARPASEHAAAAAAASPAARRAVAGSPRHLRSEYYGSGGGAAAAAAAAAVRGGPDPGVELRLTRQQMRYCLTLRRMLVAQRMARLLATWRRTALAIGHEATLAGAAAAGAAAESAVRGAQARHAHAAAYAERDRRLAGALRSASGGALGQALARWRGAMSKTSWLGRRPAGAPEAFLSARAGPRLPGAPPSLGQ